MKWLTEDALVKCKHVAGLVAIVATQEWLTIEGRRVLLATDPEGRSISGCPNIGATIKPCTSTLKVQQGYSDLLRAGGRAVCLDLVTGLTDGTPPGVVKYEVFAPGQDFVGEAS